MKNDVSTQLLFSTVKIVVITTDSKQRVGTGFVYLQKKNNKIFPLLVSNEHITKNADKIFLSFYRKPETDILPDDIVLIEIPAKTMKIFESPSNDISLIPIGGIINQSELNKMPLFFRSLNEEIFYKEEDYQKLCGLEEIHFVGYPFGLSSQKKGLPIIRRGITATPVWSNYDEKQTFLIDAGVFPGSSGSPVFLYNQGSYSTSAGNIVIGSRIAFLGMISNTLKSRDNQDYVGLGVVVKGTQILEFINQCISEIT